VKAPLPENEAHRLKTLQDLEVLDTGHEPEFDELTEMAAKICNMPVALISLVDSNRQWFKAKVGLNVDETEREVAFCAHSILKPSEIMEVPNALLDPRFVDNTLVTDGPMFRFYAGVPLIAPNGDALGTLCVLDYKPGKLSDFQKLSLKTLSRLVVRELDLRHSYKTMRRVLGEVSDEKNILQSDSNIDEQAIFLQKQLNSRVQFEILSRRILDSTLDAVVSTDEHGMVIYWNPVAEVIFGYTEFQAHSKNIVDLIIEPSGREAAEKQFGSIAGGAVGEFTPNRFEFDAIRASGKRVSVEVSVVYLRRFGETVVTSFMRDVTERNKRIYDLRIAAMTFDGSEGIIITDADFNIIRINSSAERITGYSAEEMMGLAPHLLRPDKHEKKFLTSIWESVKYDDTWSGEIWEEHKDLDVIPLHLTISRISDSGGGTSNYVMSFSDMSKAKRDADEIYHLAFFDPLTNLPNRRLLKDRLDQTIATIGRTREKAALLFIDIDNFKDLNDHLGHDFGDLLLQKMAHRLEVLLRIEDTVARIGGDEFVIILQNLGSDGTDVPAQTRVAATKIFSALEQPYELKHHEFFSTVSIGATIIDRSNVSSDETLKQADIAMYQAKKSGRNTLRFFDPVMQAAIDKRASTEYALYNAIEENQFQLYYQKQVDDKGAVVGNEALIRWKNPSLGLVLPGDFIPLAEDSGLILGIGRWVINTACEQIQSCREQGLGDELSVSVNISPKQFYHPQFIEDILECLKRTGVDARRLKFEVTESLVIRDVDAAIDIMRKLKRLGLRFSIDDFGTGYSSLEYLSKLPLSELKIDQSFVRNMHINARPTIIIKTIISMAKSLGLMVVAEGVETQTQYDLLQSYGCQRFQGYHFGKPMPVANCEDFLS